MLIRSQCVVALAFLATAAAPVPASAQDMRGGTARPDAMLLAQSMTGGGAPAAAPAERSSPQAAPSIAGPSGAAPAAAPSPRMGGQSVAPGRMSPQAAPRIDRRRFGDDVTVSRRGHVDRGDRWRHRRAWRHRPHGFTGFYVAPPAYVYGRSWCHRHFRAGRVLRHCHPFEFRRHVHARWR